MCGIAGVLYADRERPAEHAILKAMGDAIAHRGPDAEGYHAERGVGLVHRRLSIIDLSGGDQPIGNEDGSIQVVFNGEIYNFHELRAALEAQGHRFRTNSDTEVLVHLYEECGERLVERLRGMFTFALWDSNNRRLLLARDRLGIKPLYVYRDAEKLVFGSEVKAILAHPRIDRTLCLDALDHYLAFGMVPGQHSIFERIEKLPPAHVLVATAGDSTQAPKRYWQLQFQPRQRSLAEWQEAIRAKLSETVRLHMIADVPVGAFLSGGVDSSIIVALAARSTSEPLQTFSMGFHEQQFSELPFAKEVAQQFGTRHTEEIVTPQAIELLDDLAHYYDEPFADASAVPTLLVSRLASRRVKVVLTGDGGDEAFGGYARYAHDLREAAVRRRLPRWFRQRVLGLLGRLYPKADWLPRRLRAKTAFTNLSMSESGAYANTLAVGRPDLRRRLLSADVRARLAGPTPETLVEQAYERGLADSDDPLTGMLAADVATVLPDDFLVKVDRASMACGLEVRPPLLDHEFLELAASIPSEWKVRHGETKWIFKKTYQHDVPAAVTARKKQGFEIPIDSWLRGPLQEVFREAVLAKRAPLRDLVDTAAVQKLYRAHRARTGRHGNVLWSLLILAKWAERYLADPAGGHSANMSAGIPPLYLTAQ